MEVRGTWVRLREPLCDVDERGTWVDWQEVVSWEDEGEAWGDNRFLGLPLSPFGYGR